MANTMALLERFARYLTNLQDFRDETLTMEQIGVSLFVKGTRRHERYAQKNIDIFRELGAVSGGPDYETTLYSQLTLPRPFNLHLLFGGLGSGKSTAVMYVADKMEADRDLLHRDFGCQSAHCRRRPLRIDFREYGEGWAKGRSTLELKWDQASNDEIGDGSRTSPDSLLPVLLRHVRASVIERLVEDWLESMEISKPDLDSIKRADRRLRVMRLLVLTNDILRDEAVGDRLPLDQLRNDQLDVGGPLLSRTMSVAEILSMIDKYRGATDAYQLNLRHLVGADAVFRALLPATIRFYNDRCRSSNPLNLVILDNLDQLPAPEIAKFIQAIHDLATSVRYAPILIPLRPTSVRIDYVRNFNPKLHYTPNTFHVVLRRLEEFILNVPRVELARSRHEREWSPFSQAPTSEELDTLLICAKLYAVIMAAGIDLSEPGPTTEVSVHQSHTGLLKNVSLPFSLARTLAITVDALTGLCCRYALDLASRFFENAYQDQGFVTERATKQTMAVVKASYADLVGWILRNPRPNQQHTENLFACATGVRTRNEDWPTLAKLRVVDALVSEESVPICKLVQRLGRYGIPSEITIATINALQDKYKLLVWLTTNQSLSSDQVELEKHEATLSETGEGYFRRVAGDFEYVWHCALALDQNRPPQGPYRFTQKLRGYANMISLIGRTEWKQLSFERMRRDCPSMIESASAFRRMVVLDVLFCSIAAALRAVRTAAEYRGDVPGFYPQLSEVVTHICGELQYWQRRHEMAFGVGGYIDVYDEEIEAVTEVLADEQKRRVLSDDAFDALAAVYKSWQHSERAGSPRHAGNPFPLETLLERVEERGVGIVAKPGNLGLALVERYLEAKSSWKDRLSGRLPSYVDLDQMASELSHLLDAILRSHIAPPDDLLSFCTKEWTVVDRLGNIWRKNAFTIPDFCSSDDMTDLKRKHNALAKAAVEFASIVGVDDSSHLEIDWWD